MIYTKINNCTTKFFLEERVLTSSGHPICCRITLHRKKVQFKTDAYCQTKYWDVKKESPKSNSPDFAITEQNLSDIKNAIAHLVREANQQNKKISAKEIKDIIKGKSIYKHTVLSASKEMIIHYEKTNQAPTNQEKIKKTLDYFEKFLIKTNKTEITFDDFTKQMVKDFELYLKNDVTYGNYGKKLDVNTIAKHMSRFKTFWKFAMNSEWTSKDVVAGFKIKKEVRKRQSLTLEEFKRLRDLDLSSNAEKERVRDAFIFCCYTGLRFEDSQSRISANDFLSDNNNILSFRCSKNNTDLQVPLMKGAIEIFNKYKDANFRKIKNKVLPPFTNQHVNRILKILAIEADIDSKKKLTFHLSRHTCAQLQFEAEIDEKVTGAWLGHISNSITSQYQNNYNKRLKDAADKFEAYLNSESTESEIPYPDSLNLKVHNVEF